MAEKDNIGAEKDKGNHGLKNNTNHDGNKAVRLESEVSVLVQFHEFALLLFFAFIDLNYYILGVFELVKFSANYQHEENYTQYYTSTII